MLKCAIALRALQIYSQHAHNLAARVPFFSDHEFLGEIYEEADDHYDSIIERMIGLKGEEGLDLMPLLSAVMQRLQGKPCIGVQSNSVFFQEILRMKQELCAYLAEEIAAGVSPGTEQLLGDICDKQEQCIYKLRQRLKK
jgi:DNA-binding ferritin-like protein